MEEQPFLCRFYSRGAVITELSKPQHIGHLFYLDPNEGTKVQVAQESLESFLNPVVGLRVKDLSGSRRGIEKFLESLRGSFLGSQVPQEVSTVFGKGVRFDLCRDGLWSRSGYSN